MSPPELQAAIEKILSSHHNGRWTEGNAPWCSCDDGDLGNSFPTALREATTALLSLFYKFQKGDLG